MAPKIIELDFAYLKTRNGKINIAYLIFSVISIGFFIYIQQNSYMVKSSMAYNSYGSVPATSFMKPASISTYLDPKVEGVPATSLMFKGDLIVFPSIFGLTVITYTFFLSKLFFIVCCVLNKPTCDVLNNTILEVAWHGIFSILFLSLSIASLKIIIEICISDMKIYNESKNKNLKDLLKSQTNNYLYVTAIAFNLLSAYSLMKYARQNYKKLVSEEDFSAVPTETENANVND